MLKRGLAASVPIAVGYLPIAIAFGAAAASKLGLIGTLMASALIFAGASQFALLSLISRSFLYAVVIPVFINLRHVIYGFALSRRLKLKRPYITAFGLTDEVFAASLTTNNERFVIGLELGAYTSWVMGTLIGAVLGYKLKSPSLTFALPALFFALLLSSRRYLSAIIGGAIALAFCLIGCPGLSVIAAGVLTPLIRVRGCLSTRR